MGTVAKSSITLVSISDAYSLSLTPNSCVIKADFDGSNPKLEHAYTIISAYWVCRVRLMNLTKS